MLATALAALAAVASCTIDVNVHFREVSFYFNYQSAGVAILEKPSAGLVTGSAITRPILPRDIIQADGFEESKWFVRLAPGVEYDFCSLVDIGPNRVDLICPFPH